MKINKFLTGIVCLFAFLLLLSGCKKKDDGFARVLTNLMDPSLSTGLNEGDKKSKPLDEKEVKRIQQKITENEKAIIDILTKTNDKGFLYEALGWKFMDAGMYKEAKEAYEKALETFPASPVILTLAGISTSYLAQYEPDENNRANLAVKAEFYYNKSLEAEPDNPQALYGLANLYLFIFNLPEQALPKLTALIGLEPKNYNAYFLLANTQVRLGNYDQALEAYNVIIDSAKDPQMVDRAKTNAEQIKEKLYD